jgi:hypothetical protein
VLFFLGHVKPVTEVLLELLTRVDPFRLTLEQVGAGFIRPRLGGVNKREKGERQPFFNLLFLYGL